MTRKVPSVIFRNPQARELDLRNLSPKIIIMSRQNVLRIKFSKALSQLYQAEVPRYKDLIDIVHSQNAITTSDLDDGGGRLEIERHGAIRLGTPEELHTIRRIFCVMGMFPVGYYDLSSTGIPLHATAFRPITPDALASNPFRVFTTLLRVDMLNDQVQELVSSVMSKRELFSPKLFELLDHFESNGQTTEADEDSFVKEALKTFVFQPMASVTHEQYVRLKDEHPILADIAAFSTAHINHLTPRALNISTVQREMERLGIGAKSHVEGPPERQCPILLRQTSFMAVEEEILFPVGPPVNGCNSSVQRGVHRARFGEVEQRGVAVTFKGRELYNQLLEQAKTETATAKPGKSYYSILQQMFEAFPDDWESLRKRNLAFFHYEVAADSITSRSGAISNLDDLIAEGIVTYKPIVYEDFLPISAAGIFQSNLGGKLDQGLPPASVGADRDGFIRALGVETLDEIKLYKEMQERSLQQCSKILDVTIREQ